MEKQNERFTSGLSSEQLKKFGQRCRLCGQPYGSHQAATFSCPKVPRDESAPFDTSRSFADDEPALTLPNPIASHPKLEKLVTFNIGRSARNGQCVEVVAADTLPTTKGLRHIADKRRTPKTRDHESYVICDIVGPGSLRDRLFWPDARSIHWSV